MPRTQAEGQTMKLPCWHKLIERFFFYFAVRPGYTKLQLLQRNWRGFILFLPLKTEAKTA